jgi:hypothetical protein
MKNLFSPEWLRAAADLVLVLDQHRVGASLLIVLAVIVVIGVQARGRRRDR